MPAIGRRKRAGGWCCSTPTRVRCYQSRCLPGSDSHHHDNGHARRQAWTAKRLPRMIHPLPRGERMRCVAWMKASESLRSDALHRPVGHARGRMTGLADAVVFVLAAENAAAGCIAMLIRTATAKGSSGRRHQANTSRENSNSEHSSRKNLHENLHFSRHRRRMAPFYSTSVKLINQAQEGLRCQSDAG